MSNSRSLSPILRHALESFEHGIFHYLDSTESGRKFALLHIDHAIELIFKEKVARLGQSIYRKDGKTITIYEAYTILENGNVSIPEKPRLEELHDFRNVVQHKGLTPDLHTTEFYVNEAYQFVKRFLLEELTIKLESYLPRPYIKAIEGIEEQVTSEIAKQFSEAETLFTIGTYESAVISAFVALERAIRSKVKDSRLSPLMNLIRHLVEEGKITKDVLKKFSVVYNLRSRAIHSSDRISKEQARQVLNDLKEIWELLPE